jgi:hypothetical protein
MMTSAQVWEQMMLSAQVSEQMGADDDICSSWEQMMTSACSSLGLKELKPNCHKISIDEC